jgi:hypothetical protein
MSKMELPAKKRVGLGRGLGALLQDSDSVNGVNNTRPSNPTPIERPQRLEQISSMNEISVDAIETNPINRVLILMRRRSTIGRLNPCTRDYSAYYGASNCPE